MLAALKDEYADKPVKFLSLSVEPQDDEEKVAAWLANAKAPGLDAALASMENAARLYRMGGEEPGPIPTTVFISRDGHVVRAVTGHLGDEGFRRYLKQIVP